MNKVESEIQEIIDRETRAWDEKNIDLLMTIWHHDMVFIWPKTPNSHDPVDWITEMGRYNEKRWKDSWQNLFDTHILVHNKRNTVKIIITDENDGAFAIVDVDTLWRDKKGNDFHWKGRACKVYTKVSDEWKIIYHNGLLDYSSIN